LILVRLHAVISSQSQSQSYFTTDGQSVSMSWCRAQIGTFDQRYYFLFFLFFFFFWKVTRKRKLFITIAARTSNRAMNVLFTTGSIKLYRYNGPNSPCSVIYLIVLQPLIRLYILGRTRKHLMGYVKLKTKHII
jgi:hypothetical protein